MYTDTTFCINELVNYISLVAPMRATVFIGVTDSLLSYIVFVFFHVNVQMHIFFYHKIFIGITNGVKINFLVLVLICS